MITRFGILLVGIVLTPGVAGAAAPQGTAQQTPRGAEAQGGASAPSTTVAGARTRSTSGPHLRYGGAVCMCGHGPNEQQIEAAARARSKRLQAKEGGGHVSNN